MRSGYLCRGFWKEFQNLLAKKGPPKVWWAIESGEATRGLTSAILGVAHFAETINVRPWLALPTRNIPTWRAIGIVVVDPIVDGLQDFVDRVERIHWGHGVSPLRVKHR